MQVWTAFAALAFTFLTSLAAGGFMLGRTFERIRNLAVRLSDLERDDRDVGTSTAAALAAQALAVARLEVGQAHLLADVAAIKTRLQ